VAGPGGGTVNDYYSPEINSDVVSLSGITTPDGISCSSIPASAARLEGRRFQSPWLQGIYLGKNP
jgi:hypothetical protein